MTAKEAVHDLTLALLYLNRFAESREHKDLWEIDTFRSWKSYDWDAVDQLNEEGFVIDRHGNKSLYVTEEGVVKAREILEKLGISDWERRTQNSSVAKDKEKLKEESDKSY